MLGIVQRGNFNSVPESVYLLFPNLSPNCKLLSTTGIRNGRTLIVQRMEGNFGGNLQGLSVIRESLRVMF